MSITYPTTIDILSNPSSTDELNDPSHSTQHSNENDAIEALETKVGVDSSAVATSLDYLVTNASSEDPGHVHTLAGGISDVTASADEINLLDGMSKSGSDTSLITGTEGDAYDEGVWDSNGDIVGLESLVGTGDGETDDTDTLNAFLTANAGKAVRIPAGNYLVTGTIAIPANTTVYAYGARIFDVTTHRTLVTMTSGSKLFGLELEGVDHTVIDSDGIGISIIGDDADNYKADIVIRDCYIHDMGFYGIYNNFVEDLKIINTRLINIGYGGYMGLSVENIHAIHCWVKDVTGNGTNAYGFAFTRKANTSDTTTYPWSRDSSVMYSKIEDIPVWNALNTHAGIGIDFSHNTIINCKDGIRFGGTTGDAGVAFGAPHRCVAHGNTIYGIGTGNGINCNGSTATQGASNVITGNTIYQGGIDDDSNNGGIYVAYTDDTVVNGNALYQPYSNGIVFYYLNNGFSCTGNSVIDVQTTTDTAPGCITVRSQYNEGVISGNSLVRDNTDVNNYVSLIGIKISTNTNNSIKIGQNFNSCTTAISGHLESSLFQDNMDAKCYVYLSADQTDITDTTFTKINFDTELYDVGTDFDTTNHRFTAPATGYYQVDLNIEWTQTADAHYYGGAIYVNQAMYGKCRSFGHASHVGFVSAHVSAVVYAVAGQYIEGYAYCAHGANTADVNDAGTYMSIHFLSI